MRRSKRGKRACRTVGAYFFQGYIAGCNRLRSRQRVILRRNDEEPVLTLSSAKGKESRVRPRPYVGSFATLRMTCNSLEGPLSGTPYIASALYRVLRSGAWL